MNNLTLDQKELLRDILHDEIEVCQGVLTDPSTDYGDKEFHRERLEEVNNLVDNLGL